MEAKHKENLLKLARYLWDLPENYAHFDMEYYFNVAGALRPPRSGELPTGCGTVACAVGHGPAAGIKPSDYVGWRHYTSEAFGARVLDPVWEWCFDARWSRKDNTPRGAAKRIFYMLENGAPPSVWNLESYANQERF
jgi:hypothetical protein